MNLHHLPNYRELLVRALTPCIAPVVVGGFVGYIVQHVLRPRIGLWLALVAMVTTAVIAGALVVALRRRRDVW